MKVKIIFSIVFIGIFIFSKLNMDKSFAQLSRAIKDIEKIKEEKEPLIPTIERPKIDYLSENRRDPFETPFKKEEEEKPGEPGSPETSSSSDEILSHLKVQGIIWQGRFPQAIINNQILKIGDEIEGVKVVGVDKDGVRLLFEDKEYKLSPTIEKESKRR